MKKMSYIIRIAAILLPFYMVFYGGLYEYPVDPETKQVWKNILWGFSIYLVFVVALLI